MSSQDVVKSVSRKLKYYIQVKRLEDGFDLSSAECPRLDHPPLRARPTLMYDGLHDRPLKHYFSPHEIRAVLTQFKVLWENGHENVQKIQSDKSGNAEVKRQIERYMRQYSFACEDNAGSKKKVSPAASARPVTSPYSESQLPRTTTLGEPYYVHDKRGRRILRPETTGFGVALPKRKQPHKGSYPVLRTVPTSYVTRAEAKRLLGNASKILLATELIELKDEDKQQPPQKKKRPKSGAPRSFESNSDRDSLPSVEEKKERPKSSKKTQRQDSGHNIYTYDPQGNKVYLRTESKTSSYSESSQRSGDENDSTYGSRPQSSSNRNHQKDDDYVTIEGEPADENKVPQWLRKEMKKGEGQTDDSEWVRPQSANQPSNGDGKPRAKSASSRRRASSHGSNNSNNSRPRSAMHHGRKDSQSSCASSTSRPRPASRAWDNSVQVAVADESDDQQSARSSRSARSSVTEDAAVQTGGELLRDFDPMDRILWDGEKCRYRIHIFTGSQLGSSTKARVKMALCGDRGRTDDFWLDEAKNHKVLFQKGQEDIFEVETFYVGPIRKVQLGHDSDLTAHAWFVDRVIVKDLARHIKFDIPCEKWFSAKHNGNKTIRQLPVDSTSSFVDPTESDSDLEEGHTNQTYNNDLDIDRRAAAIATASNTSMNAQASSKGGAPAAPSTTATSTTVSDTETETTTQSSSQPRRPRPPSPPAKKRNDDFFDQHVREEDYSSVIESLSHATEQDNKEDFPSAQPERKHSNRDMELRPVVDSSDNDDNDEQDQKMTPKVEVEPPKDEGEELRRGPSIYHAAKSGDLDLVKRWIKHNHDLKTHVNEKGETVLHVAASHGQLEVVQWLSINVTDLDAETPTGYTPIHQAAINGHVNCMMVLSAMGARLGSKTTDIQTPLHLAAMGGHLESVKWLVANRASLDARDLNERTPLDIAMQYEHRDVAEFLAACEDESSKPDSSFAQMRTPRIDNEESTESSGPSKAHVKGLSESDKESWHNDSRPASGHNSPKGSKTPSPPSAPKTQRKHIARRSSNASTSSTASASSNGSGSSTDTVSEKQKQKHDEELMEKRKVYEEIKEQEDSQNVSFLDAIRNELENEEK